VSQPIVKRSAAKAVGLTRYFTGKPCPHGHVAERYVTSGGCCECTHNKAVAIYAADPLAIKKALSAKIAADPAWERRVKQVWIDANPERRAEIQTASRLRRGEKCLAATRSWRAENKDQVSQYNRAYLQTHIPEKLAKDHKRRAAKRAAPGVFTAADIDRIHRQQKGRCAYCRAVLTKSFHRDHIVPLARGGTNWPKNIQLLCRDCNQHKHATPPERFARQIGLLL